jgi:hypothetical protein
MGRYNSQAAEGRACARPADFVRKLKENGLAVRKWSEREWLPLDGRVQEFVNRYLPAKDRQAGIII